MVTFLLNAYSHSENPAVRALLILLLYNGLNADALTSAVMYEWDVLADAMMNMPWDTQLQRALLWARNYTVPLYVSNSDGDTDTIVDARGDPMSFRGYNPGLHGTSPLFLTIVFREKQVSEDIIFAKAMLARDDEIHLGYLLHPIFGEPATSNFSNRDMKGISKIKSILDGERRIKLGGRWQGDEFLVKYQSLVQNSETFRQYSDRLADARRRRDGTPPVGDKAPTNRSSVLDTGEDQYILRKITHAIDEDLCVAMLEALLWHFPSDVNLNVFTIRSQLTGQNVLHLLAITFRARAVEFLLSISGIPHSATPSVFPLRSKLGPRKKGVDISSRVGDKSGRHRDGFQAALCVAMSQKDRDLQRTPLHIAARLHGSDSPIFQALSQLQDFCEQNRGSSSKSLVDEFGKTAADYAICTTQHRACGQSAQLSSDTCTSKSNRGDQLQATAAQPVESESSWKHSNSRLVTSGGGWREFGSNLSLVSDLLIDHTVSPPEVFNASDYRLNDVKVVVGLPR